MIVWAISLLAMAALVGLGVWAYRRRATPREFIIQLQGSVVLVWVDGRLEPHANHGSFHARLAKYGGTYVQSFPRLTRRLAQTRLPQSLSPLDTIAYYGRVQLTATETQSEVVRQDFESDRAVEATWPAFPESPVGPSGTPSDLDPDYEPHQMYLEASSTSSAGATNGVDARHAWRVPGGAGGGVRVCLCDKDARPHGDLPEFVPAVVSTTYPVGADHGAQALGVVGAKRNGQGVSGIAYQAEELLVSPTTVSLTADAIDRALGHLSSAPNPQFRPLNRGDILLLEIQTTSLEPIERNADVYKAIERAGDTYGIATIAAAGNGSTDLDKADGVGIGDSGSIIVGSGSAADRTRLGGCYGNKRVTSQGWGESVPTVVGAHPAGAPYEASYMLGWKDTSAAAAIVAGVAAAAQGARRKVTATPDSPAGDPLPPGDLRDLLATNSEAGDASIGGLPDLMKILDHLKAHMPLAYIRDGTEDSVDPPVYGTPLYGPDAFWSPDIIVKTAPAGMMAAIEIATGHLDRDVSDVIEPDTEYTIVVRIHNRSAVPLHARVELFVDTVATYHSPTDWTSIGVVETIFAIEADGWGTLLRDWTSPTTGEDVHFRALIEPVMYADPLTGEDHTLPESRYESISSLLMLSEADYRAKRMVHYNCRYRQALRILVEGTGTPRLEFQVRGLDAADADMLVRIDFDFPSGKAVEFSPGSGGWALQAAPGTVWKDAATSLSVVPWEKLETGFTAIAVVKTMAAGTDLDFWLEAPFDSAVDIGEYTVIASQYRPNPGTDAELMGRSSWIIEVVDPALA